MMETIMIMMDSLIVKMKTVFTTLSVLEEEVLSVEMVQ
jgi:hypothetical protein